MNCHVRKLSNGVLAEGFASIVVTSSLSVNVFITLAFTTSAFALDYSSKYDTSPKQIGDTSFCVTVQPVTDGRGLT